MFTYRQCWQKEGKLGVRKNLAKHGHESQSYWEQVTGRGKNEFNQTSANRSSPWKSLRWKVDVLQQDNDPKHTSKSRMECHVPLSSNLSYKENLWADFKRTERPPGPRNHHRTRSFSRDRMNESLPNENWKTATKYAYKLGCLPKRI